MSRYFFVVSENKSLQFEMIETFLVTNVNNIHEKIT